LAGRSYADYLAGRPTVEIEYESVAEVAGAPPSLRDLLSLNPVELSGTDGAVPTTGEEGRDRPPTGCRW